MAKTNRVAKPIFYKDENSEWRWKIKKGGNITAASTEGYIKKSDCRGNFIQTFIDMGKYIDTVMSMQLEKLKLDLIEDFKRLK